MGDLEDLQAQLDEIKGQLADSKANQGKHADLLYLFGSCLAMILSWSRNASILYCIGHGLASWVYVIYFAFTRVRTG